MLTTIEGTEELTVQESPQTLGQKLIKKSFRIYVFHILVIPTGYISKVLVSHSLTVEEVGLFYSILGIIGLLSAYNDMGLTEALQYYLPQYKHHKKWNEYKTLVIITFLSQTISALLLIGFIFVGADRLSVHYFHSAQAADLLKIFAWYFLFLNITQVFYSVVTSHQDVVSNGAVEAIRMWIIAGVTVFFWFTNSLTMMNYARIWLSGMALSAAMGIGVLLYKYRTIFSLGKFSFSKALLRQQFWYAFRVFLGANAATLFGQLDQQIVMFLLWPEQAGYYSNYLTLFLLYNAVLMPLLAFLFPIYTELHTKKETDKMQFLQNIFYKYFGVLALSFGALFLLLGKYFAIFFFGEKFIPSGILLQQTAPFLIFNIFLSLNFGLLAGIGKAKARAGSLLYGIIANVVGCVIGIHYLHLGLLGASLGLLLGRMTIFIHTYFIINKSVPVKWDVVFYVKNTLIIALLWAALWYLIDHSYILQNTMKLPLWSSLVVIGLVYYAIILLLNSKELGLFIAEVKKLKKTETTA